MIRKGTQTHSRGQKKAEMGEGWGMGEDWNSNWDTPQVSFAGEDGFSFPQFFIASS